jgi:superfamily II DNA or RNA helicase
MNTPSQLRSWQRQAIELLVSNPYYLLAAQPGAGKTITTLSAIERLQQRVLLIAPSVILNSVWQQEAQRWAHTKHLTFDLAHQLHGAERAELWFEGTGQIVTATPDTLIKVLNVVHMRHTLPVRQIVVDESQFFKNASAVRTAALHALAEFVPTWLLSGTPTPNGAIDCWSPGRILSRQGGFWQ